MITIITWKMVVLLILVFMLGALMASIAMHKIMDWMYITIMDKVYQELEGKSRDDYLKACDKVRHHFANNESWKEEIECDSGTTEQ